MGPKLLAICVGVPALIILTSLLLFPRIDYHDPFYNYSHLITAINNKEVNSKTKVTAIKSQFPVFEILNSENRTFLKYGIGMDITIFEFRNNELLSCIHFTDYAGDQLKFGSNININKLNIFTRSYTKSTPILKP